MMPLAMASPGEEVRLLEIRGGRNLRKRLADLGLNVDTAFRVITNDNSGGPLILAVKEDARVAVGRGMAHKMMVEPV